MLASYVGYGAVRLSLAVPAAETLMIRLEPTGAQLATVAVNANHLRDRFDPGGVPTVDAVRLTDEQSAELSAYLEDEWKLGRRLTLSTGLRYTHYLQLCPGEQRIYAPGSEVSGESRTGTVDFGDGKVMQRYSVETYYRHTDDLLEYRPGADFFLSSTVETDLLQGTGRSYGLKIGVSRKGGPGTGKINYTYARTFNRVAGNSLSASVNRGDLYPGYFDQPHTGNFNPTYDDGRTHRLGFNLVIRSNRPYTEPNGFIDIDGQSVPLFLKRNNGRLPPYHRLDFSWTIHNPGMVKRRWIGDWTFTVYNLYDRKNAYNIYYLPRGAGSPSQIFGSSPLGSYRLTIFGSPIVSLTYNFKFE